MNGGAEFDVLIAGAGPAGATAGLALAGAGYRTCLLEAGAYEEERVGETVAPQVEPILDEMGLGEEFREAGHGSATVARSAWVGEELRVRTVAEDAAGGLWLHLDRRRFDGWLADAAGRAGATVLGRWGLAGLERDGDGWGVDAAGANGEHRRVSARFLIDATGRRRRIATRLRARRIRHDSQVGIAAFVPASPDERAKGYYLLTEAMDAGWWYTALLPDGRLVAIFMTDGDLVEGDLGGWWRRQLGRSIHARARLGEAEDVRSPHVHAANSSRLDPVAGPGWAAIGDAALTIDPLTGMGVWHALDSARRAAYAVSAWLEGSAAELDEYAREEAGFFAEYLAFQASLYRLNQRWPGSAYWDRRRG